VIFKAAQEVDELG